MQPLHHHILIYDKDCPLCTTYTQLFVRYGFLDNNGRQAYQDMDFINSNIDAEIAKNKIALINTETKEVLYGIDAMTKVLGNRFPIITFLMKFKPLYWLMEQLYSLISYNRKIVIPVSCKNLTSCNPSKNWYWRTLFILFCCIPVQLVIPKYLNLFFNGNFINEFYFIATIIFFGQILFQTIFCIIFKERNIYDYIGHISFISFIGAIFLGLLYWLLKIFPGFGLHTEIPGMVCYGVVLAWMLLEHRRRMKLLEMNGWLTATWVLYLIFVYSFVFTL